MTNVYDVWLQLAMGFSTETDVLFSSFGEAREVFEADEGQLRLLGTLSPAQIKRLSNRSLDEAEKVVENCKKNGWRIVSITSADYPRRLAKIKNAPCVIYCDGDISFLRDRLCIAMVGSRNPSAYGREIALSLSCEMAQAGAAVVSGGALGIDSAAHEGALAAQGKTAAVLGCGFGTAYLAENEPLRREIAKEGALITEYPPFTGVSRGSFPKRNRIISGLCSGTVVLEAGEKSGSLNTAGWAKKQGKDVFAVPGDLISSSYTGANRLIADGAKPVFSAADIIEEYVFEYPELLDFSGERKRKAQSSPLKMKLPEGNIGAGARKIYDCLTQEGIHFDELVRLSGMGAAEVAQALTELELEGAAKLHEGKKYSYG